VQEGETPIAKDLRCNEQIRISPIRLIDESDQQAGIVEVREALSKAREAGLDLVEVSPLSKPPVCRIMDYGKWKYAQRKKEQKSKAHRHETALKEIRIKTPKIGDHDLEIKIGHAREFLGRGDRVQFTLRFRGRELAHLDEGKKIFDHIKTTLSEISKVDQDYRYEGKRITMTLAQGVGTKKPAGGPAAAPAVKAPAPAQRPAPAATAPAPAAAPAPPTSPPAPS
jgi:translation initiation factor IF-3